PDPIDAGVGYGRSWHATLLPPGAAVENTRNGGEQDVAPVEICGTFVEVRKAEEHRRDQQSCAPSDAPLQQVLHPGTKEKFFGHSGEEEDRHPAQQRAANSRQVAMGMNEAQRQPEHENDGREENQFAQASCPIAPAQTKIKPRAVQLPDGKKSV